MMITGIVLTSLGAIGIVTGAVMVARAESNIICGGGGTLGSCDDSGDRRAGGFAVMLLGAAGLGVGIPLTIIGARKVPARGQLPAEAGLRFGPRSASLRVTF
jgi:hypothetical protein